MFPCDRLRLPPAAVEQVLVTPVSSAQSTGSLVAPFLRRLVANLEQPGEPVDCRLADNVLDLVATLFGERTGVLPTDPATVRRSLLLTVHGWIEAHLADPDLGPSTIARANHISVRYLHRLFHDQGTSVARWVRERRLANCRRDLEDPALAQRGVQAIARRWGFEDPAHFSKIFKALLRIASGILSAHSQLTNASDSDTSPRASRSITSGVRTARCDHPICRAAAPRVIRVWWISQVRGLYAASARYPWEEVNAFRTLARAAVPTASVRSKVCRHCACTTVGIWVVSAAAR